MWLAAAASKAAKSTAKSTTSATTSPKNPAHLLDIYATVLRCLGIDHERFSFRFQGLDQGLTGVEARYYRAAITSRLVPLRLGTQVQAPLLVESHGRDLFREDDEADFVEMFPRSLGTSSMKHDFRIQPSGDAADGSMSGLSKRQSNRCDGRMATVRQRRPPFFYM
jgi:hypothetical protein